LLQAGGAEVREATAPFTADDVDYPAGTAIIRLDQPVGRWVKDLLEPQVYPEIRWPSPSAPVDRPYDMTAWTLGLLMGVRVVQVEAPFEADSELLRTPATLAAGTVRGAGDLVVIAPEPNATITAAVRLLSGGAHVSWATEPFDVDGRRFAPGTLVARGARSELVSGLARDLGLDVHRVPYVEASARLARLRQPRVALYEPWGGNIDAGWTRWVLEQHEVPFTVVRHTEVIAGGLEGSSTCSSCPTRRRRYCCAACRAAACGPSIAAGSETRASPGCGRSSTAAAPS
jgi:hypothetical protein